MKCRNCRTIVTPFITLGKIPLANTFLREEDLKKKEKKYDLTAAFCEQCYLVQLTKNIEPKDLFEEYIYFSSTSSTLKKHFEQASQYLAKKMNLTKESLVLEIASNDGIFLQYFKNMGIDILGVDPAKNIARTANERGIRTIPEFFNLKFAKGLKKNNVTADLVYGANVLAHVPKIVDFVKGVSVILKPKGTAIFEFPYLWGLFESKFDIIYHEHVFYYSVIALKNIFNNAGLEIYDIEFVKTQGGSLRIYVCHKGTYKISSKVKQLERKEIKQGLEKIITYKKVDDRAKKTKEDLLKLLKRIKKQGKVVAAYSAPAKGNIFLNYTGIGKNYLAFIVDKAVEKQGLYTPGTNMLVETPAKVMKEKPDYLLILCWNIADEVIEELSKYKKSGGTFILAIPKLELI